MKQADISDWRLSHIHGIHRGSLHHMHRVSFLYVFSDVQWAVTSNWMLSHTECTHRALLPCELLNVQCTMTCHLNMKAFLNSLHW
jgi:hypothetical protein